MLSKPKIVSKSDRAEGPKLLEDKAARIIKLKRQIRRGKEAQRSLEAALLESENRYQNLVELSPLAIAVHKQEKFVFINTAGAKLLGANSPEQIIGKSIWDFIPFDYQEKIKDRHRKIQEEGNQAELMEQELMRLDGKVINVEVAGIGVTDGGESATQIIIRDITKRKQIEKALRESEDRWRAIAQAIPVPLVISRVSDGVILYANEQISATFGVPLEQLIGCKALDFYDDPKEREVILEILKRDGYLFNHEVKVRNAEGEPLWMAVCLRFLIFNGEPATVAAFYDITERKQTEAHLHLLERAIAASNNGIVITDAQQPDNPLIYANPSFEKMTGYTAAEVIGCNCRFLQGDNKDQPQLKELRAAIREGRESHIILRNYRKDGSWFWNELHISPVSDLHGQITHFVGVQNDITELYSTQERLRLMESCVVSANDAILITEAEAIDQQQGSNIVYVNEAFTRMTGYTAAEIIGQTPRRLYGAKTDRQQLDKIRAALKEWQSVQVELINYRKDGSEFWVEMNIVPIANQKGWFTHWVSVQRDITSRKQAEALLRESQERYELAVRGANDGLWDWNLKTNEVYFSCRWKSMLGNEENEISNTPDGWFNRIHSEDLVRVKTEIAAHLEGNSPHFESEHRMRHADGTYRWMLSRGLAVRDENKRAYRMAGSQTDITDRKVAEEQLIHDAFHDTLTGLPNRALFMDRLGQAIARTKRRHDYRFAVLFLDLDRFKVVNESLGHSSGDRLLNAIAQRLKQSLRPENTLARLGGDEFTILLEDIHTVDDATEVAQQIHKQLALPFHLDGHEVYTTASIGITLSFTGANGLGLEDGENTPNPDYHWPGYVLRDGSIAMYRAKAMGTDRYTVFDKSMHARAVARLELETDLRRTLQENSELLIFNCRLEQLTQTTHAPEFFATSLGVEALKLEDKLSQGSINKTKNPKLLLHYQPIVCLHSGEIRGFEALARLNHPVRGLVPPAEFIPVAEETGLIVPLGTWVLREACRQMRAWQMTCPQKELLTISVNLSSKQFMQPNLIEQVDQILQETGLDGRSLKLEITESVIMENVTAAIELTRQLRERNIELSIDDFGTGYSSLSYLHHFPINTLKIDRSFISRMSVNGEAGHDDMTLEIVQTIITLAHNLGIDVTAEGIETEQQLNRLRALQCEQGQGYFFSKPLDSQAASGLLAAKRHW